MHLHSAQALARIFIGEVEDLNWWLCLYVVGFVKKFIKRRLGHRETRGVATRKLIKNGGTHTVFIINVIIDLFMNWTFTGLFDVFA